MRPLTRSTTMAATALGAGALLALAVPVAAHAHVTITPDSTAAGSYTVLEFSSGHGCDGSPTTSFTVDIPEQILSVTPTLEAGWTVEKVMVALDEPVAERLLVFIDDDEVPQPNWLAALLDTWASTQASAVMGRVVSIFPTPPTDPWVLAGGFFTRPSRVTGTRIDVAATRNLLLDLDAVRAHGVGLADRLRAAVGLPAQGSPIVALGFKDPVERLAEAGVVAGARAGRARLGFHIYNTEADVERVVDALS